MKKAWHETIIKLSPSADGHHTFAEEEPSGLEADGASVVTAEAWEQQRLDGVIIGKLVGLPDVAMPLVDFPANSSDAPLRARSIVPLGKEDVGRDAALTFEGGDPQKPIVMGLIQHPEGQQPQLPGVIGSGSSSPLEMQVDGEHIVFTAEREIVLRCGKASITLTRAGKVIIRGGYLLSRSSGVNRIKGGSVQIN
jgi:hypothetical protein